MHKLFAIIFSTLIFIQSTIINFDDVLQLDDFIEHYEFHAVAFGDNFFVYVSKHYGVLKEKHDTNERQEKEQHERLPFNHHTSSNAFTDFVLNLHETNSLVLFSEIRNSNIFYIQDIFSSYEKQKVFQPPQQA